MLEHNLANKVVADSNFDANKLEWKLPIGYSAAPEKQRIVLISGILMRCHTRNEPGVRYKRRSSQASYHHAARKLREYIRIIKLFIACKSIVLLKC